MFERLGNALAWLSFVLIVTSPLLFMVGLHGRDNWTIASSGIWGYPILLTIQYIVWGKMRFLPWKQ